MSGRPQRTASGANAIIAFIIFTLAYPIELTAMYIFKQKTSQPEGLFLESQEKPIA